MALTLSFSEGFPELDEGTVTSAVSMAEILRDYADQVEQGKITGCVFVGTDGGQSIHTFSDFQSRLEIVGALEHAKGRIGEH